MILRTKKAREENHDWDQIICLFNFIVVVFLWFYPLPIKI